MEDEKDPTTQEELKDQALERASVRQKIERVKSARKFHEPQFKRMRENSEFAYGIQRRSQDTLDDEQYCCNFINREVNQKVATLYARDPKAVFKRKDRMDFTLWDGDPMTKMAAGVAVTQAQMMGMPPTPALAQAAMLLQDIEQGEAWRHLLDRVGTTLEKLYAYQCDTQTPDFKYQMKQLVRRVVTCGVGYVRLNFVRQGSSVITSATTDDSVSMRVKRAKLLLEQIEDDKITEEDPRVLEVQYLMQSVASSVVQRDDTNVEERLEFDFPSATSIIVDQRCRSLKGFIGARWIAQQYIVPLEFVQAYFEKPEIKADEKLLLYHEDGQQISQEKELAMDRYKDDPSFKPLVCLWEYFDLDTKSYCWLVDGYKDYVMEPTPCDPCINRFWPIFALTFNDIELEPGSQKVSIFPPSDVDLLKSMQRATNRSREGLREHRNQNVPFYVTGKGWLTEEDLKNLNTHESGQVIEVQGVPPGGDLSKALVAFVPAPIRPEVYDTAPYEQDATLVVGTNQPQPPPKAREAATPAVIQEQARISGTNSNVDDLDDLLTELAGAAGEMMLREFSKETVTRVVGRGAVWPEENREDFLNSIFLQHVAASSGRPNKAVEIANAERIVPLMIQAGANPWTVISKILVPRLDDRLDVADFAPTQPPSPVPAAKPQGQSPHAPATGGGPGIQPQQPNMASQPVPLPGH